MRAGGIGPCVAERPEAGFAIGDRGEVFRRSRVERASRSNLITISTSPASICSSALRSWVRSVFAPLAVSRKTFLHPCLGELAHLCPHALAVG